MPFYPPDISGLTWWLKPQHYPLLAQDDPITFWPDEGGQQENATQVDPAVAPTYELNAVNGFPAAKFNGVDQFMDGPGASGIIDPAHYSVMISAYFPDVTTEQTLFSAGSQVRMYVENDEFKTLNAGDTSTYPITVGWHTVALQKFGNTIRSMVDDPFAKILIPTSPPATAAFLIGKDAGGNFFNGMILEIIIHIFGQQQQSFAKTFAYAMRNCIDRGEPLEQERDSLSRRMAANERSRMVITMDTPLNFLNSELLQPHAMSHPQIPHPSGEGAGLEKWNRRVLNLMGRTEKVGQYTLSLELADRTGVSHLYRESGVAEFTAAPRREGVAVSGMGVRRLYSHQTELLLPAPSGIVDQVLPGNDLGHPDGTFQDAETAINYLLRSSFVDGLDDITVTGASGSVDVIDDVSGAIKLFGVRREPTDNGLNLLPITTKHIKMTAGNPHTADLVAEWPLSVIEELDIMSSSVANPTVITTAETHGLTTGDEITIIGHTGSTPDINGTHVVVVVNSNTFTIPVDVTIAGEDGNFEKLIQPNRGVCLSVDHLDSDGALFWALQNDQDSEWWDDVAEGWDPSLVWNEFPEQSFVIGRSRSNPIIYSLSTWRALVQLGLPNVLAVDASEHDVYHLQLDDHPFPTSRWVQDNTYIGRRKAVGLCFFENPAAKMFNEPCFTIAMRITPPWNGDDLLKTATAGGHLVDLWKVQYANPPTGDYWAGRFKSIAEVQQWELAINNDPSVEVAFQDTNPPQRGVEIPVIWRCTSAADGELDLEPNTMSVFADGVRGTDRPFTIIRPTPIVNPRLEFNLHGATVRDVHFDYRVWSDEECVAWSLL